MSNKINIFIPQPCHENWQEMTTLDKGRFCNSCQKKVIDFTTASDREISNAVKANENLCGRFNVSQLNRDLIVPKEKNSIWLAACAAIISFLGIGTNDLVAQETVKTEQTDKKVRNESIRKSKKSKKFIEGVVSDDTGTLPGAIIKVKGTSREIQSDVDGKFKIEAKKGDILVTSFTGYDDNEISITNQIKVEIHLKDSTVKLDAVPTMAGGIRRR